MRLEAIRAAHDAHRGILRAGMYVPTRREVREAPVAWLANVLMDWFRESPSELIPTDEQVDAVVAELEARSDAGMPEIRKLVADLRGS